MEKRRYAFRSPLPLFLLLAFGISWGIAGIAYLLHVEWEGAPAMVVGGLFMLAPATAAFLVRRHRKGPDMRSLGVTTKGIAWRWVFIALLMGGTMLPGTLMFNRLFGDILHIHGFGHTEVSLGMFSERVMHKVEATGNMSAGKLDEVRSRLAGIPVNGGGLVLFLILIGLVAACTANLPFTFGEEFGWRGWLQYDRRHWGYLRSTLFIGIVWGLWHAPIILQGHNYGEHTWAGVIMMVAFTTLLAFPFAWVRERAACIWAPCLLHGTVNATANGVDLFTVDASPMLGSCAGVSGMCVIVVWIALLLLFDRDLLRSHRVV